MSRWIISGVLGVLALGVAAGSTALAQTTLTTTGAFDTLSPGNQKIATALFQAQTTTTTPTTATTGTTSTTAPLTVDQIAEMKQSGKGWGQVFKDMKAQGLVQEKNLGQVVSKYSRSTHGGTVTTASGRQMSTSGSQHTAQGGSEGGSTQGKGNASMGGGHGNGSGNAAHGGGKGGK